MPERPPRRPEKPNAERVKPAARDPELVNRVFGEPLEIDGIKLIPVAAVRRCGHEGSGDEGGKCGCSCVNVRPVGLVVIRDGRVGWKPAFDVNRLMLTLAALTGLFLLLGRRRRG
ncbi:MAG: sporulation protein [Gaiellaceae bacterium]